MNLSCWDFFHTHFFVQNLNHCTLRYACVFNYSAHFDSSINQKHIVNFVNHFESSHFHWRRLSVLRFIYHVSETKNRIGMIQNVNESLKAVLKDGVSGFSNKKSWRIRKIKTMDSFLGHANPFGSPSQVIGYKFCQRV